MKRWQVVLIAMLVPLACMAWKVKFYNWNVSSLLNVSSQWSHYDDFAPTLPIGTVVLTESQGYDTFGFYYLAARDPFLQRDEWKSGKYQRWIFPLASWLLAFGNETGLPWSMALIQLIAVGWIAWELCHILEEQGRPRVWALWGACSAGLILSALYLITEPLAFAFLLSAWRFGRADKWVLAALLMCLSIWTREAQMVAWAAWIVVLFWHRRWRPFALIFVSFVPVVIWDHMIGHQLETLGPPYIKSGGSFGLPFVGFVEQLQKASAEQGNSFWYRDVLIVPYCLVMLAAFWAAWKSWWSDKDLASMTVLAFGAQGILFMRPMWEGFFAISRLETGMVLAFLVLPVAARNTRAWRFALWAWGGFILLALARSARFAPDLHQWVQLA